MEFDDYIDLFDRPGLGLYQDLEPDCDVSDDNWACGTLEVE